MYQKLKVFNNRSKQTVCCYIIYLVTPQIAVKAANVLQRYVGIRKKITDDILKYSTAVCIVIREALCAYPEVFRSTFYPHLRLRHPKHPVSKGNP